MYSTGVAASRGVWIAACSFGEGRGQSCSWWCEGLTSVGNFPKPCRKKPGLWYSDSGITRKTCPYCVLNSEFEGFETCKRWHSSTEENAIDRGWEAEKRPRWHEEAKITPGVHSSAWKKQGSQHWQSAEREREEEEKHERTGKWTCKGRHHVFLDIPIQWFRTNWSWFCVFFFLGCTRNRGRGDKEGWPCGTQGKWCKCLEPRLRMLSLSSLKIQYPNIVIVWLGSVMTFW